MVGKTKQIPTKQEGGWAVPDVSENVLESVKETVTKMFCEHEDTAVSFLCVTDAKTLMPKNTMGPTTSARYIKQMMLKMMMTSILHVTSYKIALDILHLNDKVLITVLRDPRE